MHFTWIETWFFTAFFRHLAAVNFEICHAWVHLSLRWLGLEKICTYGMYVYIFLYLEIRKNSWVLRSKLHPGVNIWMFFFSSDQNSSFDLFSRIPDTKYKYYWWCSSFQYTVSTIRAIKRLAFYKTWIFPIFFLKKPLKEDF